MTRVYLFGFDDEGKQRLAASEIFVRPRSDRMPSCLPKLLAAAADSVFRPSRTMSK
jgi:hypothetical protein